MTPASGGSVAIVGATGAVGQELLAVLEQRRFPVERLRLFASERSAGRRMAFRGEELAVEPATPQGFEGVALAFFSAGAERSRSLVPEALQRGAVVIDNSSAFRMQDGVPLVVPEVNAASLAAHRGLIANPNCSTIQLVVVLAPIHAAVGIRRVIVSTYQAASGAGARAMEELEAQLAAEARGERLPARVFPFPLAYNCLPHIDRFEENGYTREEMKMVLETRKILGEPALQVSATCVRVPVRRSHSEAISIETVEPIAPQEARELLSRAPGVVVVDDPVALGAADGRRPYPMPVDVAGSDEVHVGRIRRELAFEQGIALWCVADQLRKGAATNAVQIAERLYGP